MKIVDLIRLIRKHLALLVLVPALLGTLVAVMTKKGKMSYTSQTVLYTGLATGSSIEMDKAFNYFATNTSFENLINIVNSRKTQQEVAIRLLSQHLLLPGPDPKYISAKSYAELKKITPQYIYSYVARGASKASGQADTVVAPLKGKEKLPVARKGQPADSSEWVEKRNLFPAIINHIDYEHTVSNLTELMKSSDTNFVYKLLNFENPHYSIKAISSIKAMRIGNSDLIKLTYEIDDPGICQQTLNIFNEVCIKNYKTIKENRSDEVVRYFESQLRTANQQLKTAEDKLLAFNKENNIINYYEQSKAVAVVKEDMGVDYANKKAQLAGLDAAIKRLEEKLNIQELVQVKSSTMIDKKKQLGDLNYEIAMLEASRETDSVSRKKIPALQQQAEALKNEIKKSVDDLYHYQNSTDGLPVNNVLSQWINNVIEAENLRAKIMVMDQNNRDFQQQYSIYAPAGANIKRIEREISVSEQGYLEILHGLNLAKLKLQDNELSSDLKAVDPPFYPISPIATKRGILIIAAGFVGGILVLAIALLMEYFDRTIKNQRRAEKLLGMPALGMIPKIYLKPGIENFAQLKKRLIERITQHIEQALEGKPAKTPRIIAFLSTQEKEGKSVLAGNILKELKLEGYQAMLINLSNPDAKFQSRRSFPIFHRLLGYQDPRIQYDHPFLAGPSGYLGKNEYLTSRPDQPAHPVNDRHELLKAYGVDPAVQPDFVLIELPALLVQNFPACVLRHADFSVVVCRSNRMWSEADQGALNTVLPIVQSNIRCLVNGVEMQELESIVGELPKKRSRLRKYLKNLFRFQFFTKNQF